MLWENRKILFQILRESLLLRDFFTASQIINSIFEFFQDDFVFQIIFPSVFYLLNKTDNPEIVEQIPDLFQLLIRNLKINKRFRILLEYSLYSILKDDFDFVEKILLEYKLIRKFEEHFQYGFIGLIKYEEWEKSKSKVSSESARMNLSLALPDLPHEAFALYLGNLLIHENRYHEAFVYINRFRLTKKNDPNPEKILSSFIQKTEKLINEGSDVLEESLMNKEDQIKLHENIFAKDPTSNDSFAFLLQKYEENEENQKYLELILDRLDYFNDDKNLWKLLVYFLEIEHTKIIDYIRKKKNQNQNSNSDNENDEDEKNKVGFIENNINQKIFYYDLEKSPKPLYFLSSLISNVFSSRIEWWPTLHFSSHSLKIDSTKIILLKSKCSFLLFGTRNHEQYSTQKNQYLNDSISLFIKKKNRHALKKLQSSRIPLNFIKIQLS
ncbi:tata box-binding protein associated factor RNA polymerase i subunit a [Anaeramoeba ignava]|uniref:Tata box-binding protein associated factor RNA polymerase i subunit a n=1 Tax=Anaeramoeba ignava TaxID=1746090 RepID=A0A9Q0LJM0_ANAIG|nr:tata box-binding protein associated factor RNA polymerase i subunit a [Anaeramoeba ignava]